MYILENVYKLKLLVLGIYRVTDTYYILWQNLSQHRSLKFYLYELVFKIRMILVSKETLT